MSSFEKVNIVTPSEANDVIVEKCAIVLDVRTPEEYKGGHLENAVNLPLDKLDEKSASEVIRDLDQIVLVYCKTGVRSLMASEKLVDMGYENICDMDGGIDAWPFGIVA